MIQGIAYNMNLNNKILLAGPWMGEFGWELFCWQGYVRKLSKNYDETIIISRTGHEFLYRDFANKYYNYDTPASKANMWLGEIDQLELKKILYNVKYSQHLMPFNIGFSINGNTTKIVNNAFNQQDFLKYESDTLDKNVDILVHARNKIVGSDRNWNKSNWQALVNLLLKKYTIGVIGTDEAFYLDGTEDLRNLSVEDLVSVINKTKLVVGQSSGPLHLASLCGTPHLVWSDNVNRERYEKQWNPFKTPVYFYSEMGWNPTVDYIYNKIIENVK
jgi:hypothetical protein